MRTMSKRHAIQYGLALAIGACGGNDLQPPPAAARLEPVAGNGQSGPVGNLLTDPLRVRVTDASGNAVAGVSVSWSVVSGGGAVSPTSSSTDADGLAASAFTLGPAEGDQQAQAEVAGLAGSPAVFTAHGFTEPPVPSTIAATAGDGQTGPVGTTLPDSLRVQVTDDSGHGVPGVAVNWSVLDGGGSVSPASSITDGAGTAATAFTLGPTPGAQRVQAEAGNLVGPAVVFSATATEASHDVVLSVAGGGNNVPERYSSDLWVHGNYAYTGTWGSFFRVDDPGDVLKVWSLGASGAPVLVDSVNVPQLVNLSDVQVSEDGRLLMFTGEYEPGGVYLYSLADPAHPAFLNQQPVENGVHTGTLAEINGQRYVFASRSPGPADPAMLIFNVTDPLDIQLTATVPEPANYGIHDTYVRDGLCFAFVWNTGVIIYDVGNGIRGGSPSNPREVGRVVTSTRNAVSPAVHNGWWFHNPVTNENRYLFVGQEGPSIFGEQASGDIHVVDVSDLAHPKEVAFFHLNGAGTHNFWMDEENQILYAAYYNGGVVALDVSGTLSGDLSSRLLSQIRPGGSRNTFTWGVQLANGSLYAIDMLSGFWQLKTE
jgi:hypothetical protein